MALLPLFYLRLIFPLNIHTNFQSNSFAFFISQSKKDLFYLVRFSLMKAHSVVRLTKTLSFTFFPFKHIVISISSQDKPNSKVGCLASFKIYPVCEQDQCFYVVFYRQFR